MISSSLFYPPWNRSEYMLGREGRRKPHLELTDGKTEIKSPLRSRVRGDNEYVHCTGNHGFVRLVEHWELRYKRWWTCIGWEGLMVDASCSSYFEKFCALFTSVVVFAEDRV